MFQNFIRLSTGLKVEPLLNALGKKPHLWDEITARQSTAGSPHADTKSIFLRWCENQTIQAAFTDLKAIDYPAFLEFPEAWPLIETVLEQLKTKKLGRILITSLQPGGVITPHADEGAYADHYERFHVCVQSDLANTFSVEHEPWCGEYVHMAPGELWWFNHKKSHAVFNGSKSPRIHLIIDAVAPLYRMERHAIPA